MDNTYIIKRRFSTYKVNAKTRSKARYQAYLQYCAKTKKPKSFKAFFMSISKIERCK